MGKHSTAKVSGQKAIKAVQMQEAKTHLSRLVGEAVGGKPFFITVGHEPAVRVVAFEPQELRKRYGFLDGRYKMPENFKEAFRKEIEEMFYGKS